MVANIVVCAVVVVNLNHDRWQTLSVDATAYNLLTLFCRCVNLLNLKADLSQAIAVVTTTTALNRCNDLNPHLSSSVLVHNLMRSPLSLPS